MSTLETITEDYAENAIAVQKGKDDLLEFINECIDEYYADGTYDTLWTK